MTGRKAPDVARRDSVSQLSADIARFIRVYDEARAKVDSLMSIAGDPRERAARRDMRRAYFADACERDGVQLEDFHTLVRSLASEHRWLVRRSVLLNDGWVLDAEADVYCLAPERGATLETPVAGEHDAIVHRAAPPEPERTVPEDLANEASLIEQLDYDLALAEEEVRFAKWCRACAEFERDRFRAMLASPRERSLRRHSLREVLADWVERRGLSRNYVAHVSALAGEDRVLFEDFVMEMDGWSFADASGMWTLNLAAVPALEVP